MAGKKELHVEQVGSDLHVAGLVPRYLEENLPTDLMREYEITAKYRAVGKPRKTGNSPDVLFANADTDEKLVAFVRRYGPVVAKEAFTNLERPEKGVPEPRLPLRLSAVQGMQELRNEQVIFRSALAVVIGLTEPNFDFPLAQSRMGDIAAKIVEWPGQWEREKRLTQKEPFWNLRADAIERIKGLTTGVPFSLLPPFLDSRIVLCELVNAFRPIVFPNPLEMHASIKYGIRPLLYAILRLQFLHPRDVSICSNTQCRNFFQVERRGQQFCGAECSIHQRQRNYWATRGRRVRKKRLKQQGSKRSKK
jgi:hypothetical protein